MARRSLIVALGVISALAVLPAGAAAATAPAAAPVLTSAPYATLVSFHWTPGRRPQHVAVGLPQRSGRARSPVSARSDPGQPDPGQCDDGFHRQRRPTASTATSSRRPTWSRRPTVPGLTVIVDTHDPAATIAIPNASSGGRRQRHGHDRLHECGCRLGRRLERAAHRRDRSVSVGTGHRAPRGTRPASSTASTTSATSSPTMPATSPSPRSR